MADAQWTDYAQWSHNGKGGEGEIDYASARKLLARYAKKRNPGHKGMAIVTAAVGVWTRGRLH